VVTGVVEPEDVDGEPVDADELALEDEAGELELVATVAAVVWRDRPGSWPEISCTKITPHTPANAVAATLAIRLRMSITCLRRAASRSATSGSGARLILTRGAATGIG